MNTARIHLSGNLDLIAQTLILCSLLTADIIAGTPMGTVEMKSQGPGHLTSYGKRMVGESMYTKGKNFAVAALLLRQRHGYEYVVLHLLCQGIEITLKGLLMMRNYDKYKGKLKHTFGHDINKLIGAAVTEFNVHPVRPAVEAELEMLSSLSIRATA
jgi:hypothetical protein